MPTNKQYPPELKERAVVMVLGWRRERNRTDGGLNEVAEKLGVHPESVRNWVNHKQVDAGERPGLTSDGRGEMAELRRENKDLRRANEILKSAAALFGSAARPPTEQVVAYVDAHKASFGVEPICEVLEVAPSIYYAAKNRRPCARALRDAELKIEIERVYAHNHHVYGPRKRPLTHWRPELASASCSEPCCMRQPPMTR